LLRDIYLGLKFSFSYFSILPIKFKQSDDLSKKEILKYMILFLPFVGMTLSFLVVIGHQLFDNSLFISLIFSVFYFILYGFIHTEAIADVVDAVYATHGGKDPYIVIKEPTVGAMGLLYTVSFLILKIASLTYILYEQCYLEFIVISILSRMMVISGVVLNEFKSSFISMIKSNLNKANSSVFFIVYSFISYYMIGIEFFWLLIISIIVSIIIIKNLFNKLGFINGDVMGFKLELNELVLMTTILLI